jgi:hypothetical protein
LQTKVTPPIKRALDFFIEIVPLMRVRTFSVGSEALPPVLIWTDASFEGGKGKGGLVALVRDGKGGRQVYTAEHEAGKEWTDKFDPNKKQYIGQFEMLYASGSLETLGSILKGRQIIHFIDNTSALAGLIKGYASMHDMGFMVNAYHAMALGLECETYFEYVRSEANVADMPSRQAMRELERVLKKAGFQEKEISRLVYRLPSIEEWQQPADKWVQRAVTLEPKLFRQGRSHKRRKH